MADPYAALDDALARARQEPAPVAAGPAAAPAPAPADNPYAALDAELAASRSMAPPASPSPASAPAAVAPPPAIPIDPSRLDNAPTLDAAGIERVLADAGSPWAIPGIGRAIYDSAVKHGIDPAALLAISQRESNHGTVPSVAREGNNPGDIVAGEGFYGQTGRTSEGRFGAYPDIQTGFDALAWQLRKSYIDGPFGDGTFAGLNKMYAPASENSATWGQETQAIAQDLRTRYGGTPAQVAPAIPQQAAPATTTAPANPFANLDAALAQSRQVAPGATSSATTAPTAPTIPLPEPVAALAAGARDLGANVRAATRGVPFLGGAVDVLGDVAAELGAGKDLAARIPDDIGIVTGDVKPPPPAPGEFPAPTGIAAVPNLLGDLAGTLFSIPKAFNPIAEAINENVAKPAVGLVESNVANLGGGALATAGILTGNRELEARGREIAQLGTRGFFDPTRMEEAVRSEVNRAVGEVPVLGGLADLLTGGQTLNPANYIGTGALGGAVRATRGVPVVGRAVQALDLTDRAISRGLGAPIELPLKALGAVAPKIPVAGKLFDLSREAKYIKEGEELVATARGFLNRTGRVDELVAISRGEKPAALNYFTPKEQKAIGTVADAYRDALARTGGKATPTTEAEFTEILTRGLQKKHGIAETPNALAKAVNFAQATVKEGWLALNPGYYGTNALGNTLVGLMGGFLPRGEGAYNDLMARRGLPLGLGRDTGFIAGTFGKGKGLFRSLPGIGGLMDATRTGLGEKAENVAKYGARIKRFNERIQRETDNAVTALRREFQGRVNPEQMRHAERVLRAGVRPDQVAGLLKGEGPWYAHMKDWGENAGPWGTEIAEFEGKLAAMPDPRTDPAAFRRAKDQLVKETSATVRNKAKTLQQNTWIGSRQVRKQERQAYLQMYSALRNDGNPERVLEMLYALRSATQHSAEFSANAKAAAAGVAGTGRQAIYHARHELASDWIDAANAALAMVKSHPYGEYSPQTQQGVQAVVAGLIDRIGKAAANMRQIEKAAKDPANGITDDLLEEMWAQHHAAVLDLIDDAGNAISHGVKEIPPATLFSATPPRPTDGWKLHLAIPAQNRAEVGRVLGEMRQAMGFPDFKLGLAGGQVGKDATVYVGARDEAQRVADAINNRVGHLLGPPAGDTLVDDIPFGGKVMGRFDLRDRDFHQYGSAGIPYLRADMQNRVFGGGISDADARTRAAKELERRFGTFFTGVPEGAMGTPGGPALIPPAARSNLRGPGFWDNLVSELASQSYDMRSANRATLGDLADRMVNELTAYGKQLDNLPQDVAAFEGSGAGLWDSPALQAEFARRATALYGQANRTAYDDAVGFGDRMLFNYSATTNLDKLLQFFSPFTIWQTRAIPLFASLLAERPGALRAVTELQSRSVEQRQEEGALPSGINRGTFVRSSPLDGLYSRLIGRPVQTFADPFGSFVQGGPAQFDQPPFLREDQSGIAQAIQVGGFLGGGLTLWPWWQAALNLTDNNGRQVSYGDLFAPSRALRYFGADIEAPWKKFLLQAQGIESETGNPFLDRQIRERIAQIAEEEGGYSEAQLLRAMDDESDPLHIRARKEAEKEANTLSLLRWFLPLGVKTLSPGGKDLADLEAQYKGLPDKDQSKFFRENPALAAIFQKNASAAKLEIMAGNAEYNALGTQQQRDLYNAYYALPRDQQRRYAELHPKEYAQVRALTTLRGKFKQDPANALAVAYMDARNRARDADQEFKLDDWLTGQGIPKRVYQQDTRDPMQEISQALAESRGLGLVAQEQEQGKLGAKLDAYYAVSDPVKSLSDQYFNLPEGSRERSAFLRANPALGQAWDKQRAMRDNDAELAAYISWAQRRRDSKLETGLAAFLDERKAGRAPTPPRSTGTAANPSRAA